MDRENKVKEYVAQLESNPYDLTPLGRLEEAFDSQGGAADLVALLEERAPEVASSDAAARLYLEAARMASAQLQDKERGTALLTQSLSVGEDTLISIEAYLFELAMQDDQEELEQYFAQALEHDPDEAYQSRLYQRMGCILEDFVGDLEQADTAYRWALDLDPANFAALWSRKGLARKEAAWERLANLLIEEIESTVDPLVQADLSVKVGRIYLEHLDSKDSAEQCFAFAYELDPSHPGAQDALRELGYEIGEESAENGVAEDTPMTMELDEAMLVGEELIDNTPSEEGLEEESEDRPMTMELEAGMLIEEEEDVPAPPEAPDLPEASEEVSEGQESREVSEVSEVEEEEEEEESSEEVSEVSEAEEEEEEEESSEEMSEVSEEEVEEEESEEIADVSEGEEISEVSEVSEVEASEEEQEDEEELPRRTWRDRFDELCASGAGSLDMLVKAARLQARHPEDSNDALRIWGLAVDNGLAPEFYEQVGYLYEQEHVWNEVLEMLEDAGEGAVKARVLLFNLHNSEAAKNAAEEAGSNDILETLEDLEEAQSNWRKFQRALEKKHADLDEDEKALTVYLRMADLAAALDDADKEIDALRRLERQVDDTRVSNRLMVLYQKAEKWPMYVDLLKKEAEALGEDQLEEKADILYEVVRVYRQEMNHDRMAINIYKEILEAVPHDLQAIDDLMGLYDEMNMSSDLINMLQVKAELVKGKSSKVEIYSNIARLFLEKFRNQAEAIKAYEKVLEIDLLNGEAITFLKEMYEKRRDWESLIDVHKREIETFTTTEEKVAGLKEVAELATDRLRKPDVATELWLEVREVAPEDSDALDALEKLYEKNRDYEALAEILYQKGPLTDDSDERMKLYQKLGTLYSDRLEDSERAVEAWRAALELQPDDLKSRKALERLYIDNRQWDDLEQFYAATDAYSDLVRILGTLTGTIKEDEIKIELLLRSARIWREELDDTSRAERELERALQIDEHNQAAAAQLEPIYLEAEDHEKLRDVIEIVLSHLEEPEDCKTYQLKLGRLHRDVFGDWNESFRWISRAFRQIPSERDIVSELEQAAAEAGTWTELVEHYQQALDEDLSGDDTLQLRLLLGRVLSEEVEDLDAALEQFQAVLDVEEENRRALEAMEGIYRRSERWDDLMKIYRHRLELEEEAAARVGILQGMANIAEVEAGDIATAIARFNEALELDQRNEITLAELHRLYAGESEFADLAEVIRQEIDLIERRARLDARRLERKVIDSGTIIGGAVEVKEGSIFGDEFGESDEGVDDVLAELREGESSASEEDLSEPVAEEISEVEIEDAGADADEPDEAGQDLESVDLDATPSYLEEEIEALTALRFELGTICKEHLGEVEEALEALGKVLNWRPSHEAARDSIEALLEDSLYRLSVAKILEPVYEVHGEWEALVEVLSVQADAAEETAVERELHRRIGVILVEEIGDGARAFERYGKVLKLTPSDEDGRAQLYRIAHELELWDAFADLYEEVLPTLEDEDLRIEYFYTLSGVHGTFREEHDEARRYLEEVCALRPDAMRALDDLEELFAATKQWRELLGVIDRKIDLIEDPSEVQAHQFRKAVVWEELLEEPLKAIAIYQEILGEEPENLEAFSYLDGLYQNQGMWNELAANLERELELVPEEERHGVKNRLAGVLEANLNNADGAVDLYEEVLAEDPDDQDAINSMEELMRESSAPQGRISKILEPLYIELDAPLRLIEALEVQVEVNIDPDERVELLHRVAALHEDRNQDQAQAFTTYARALSDGVENQTTLDALYRLAEETHGFEELVQVFEAQAGEQTNPDVKRDMLRRASAIYIDPLAELGDAADRLHSVLELFPADLETVEELEEIYRHTQQWPELVDILVIKADLVEELDAKQALFHQAGTLYEDILGNPEEAISIYNRAMAVDEGDRHAIDRLEVLYTDLERWHDLLDVYRRKLDLAEDDSGRKDLLYVMGAIYQEHLQQPDDAIDTYRRILDLDPEELGALEKLDELFEATEQWHELLETLEQQLQLSAYAEEQETLRYRTGRLWEIHLTDGLRAVEVFEAVLTTNPDHEPSIEALEGMVERGENEAGAARVLQPLYQNKGQWEKLVHIHRLLITASHDRERKIELYKEVASILENQLEDPAEAFATYVEALQVDPGREELLETLERLAQDLDGWEVLIEQIDARLEDITDFEVATRLHLRIARIYEEELHEAQDAIERFQRVLEIEPAESSAVLALDRLYQREGQWEQLGEILKTRVYGSDDPDEALQLRLRLGMLYQTALEDAESAITTYQEVLMEDAENATAIDSLEQMFMEGRAVDRISDILEPFYLERNQHEKLVEIYLQRLETLDDPLERFNMLMLVARIFLGELGDLDRALQSYGAALSERPDDEQVLTEIERLAEQTQDWSTVAEFFVDALESPHNTDDSRLILWGRLATILDVQLEQPENAEQAYLQVLEIDPTQGKALEALDRIYQAEARWPELASILERRIEGMYDEFEVVELSYRLAQVFQGQLGDFERAVDTYEKILTIQPDHQEALQHLEYIHMTLQAWLPLFEVLERRSQLTHDPDEQAEFFARMASIAEDMLERKEDAIDLWRRVTEVRPDDLAALQELRRLYLDDERWDDLVSVLRREVELASEPDEQLNLFESLGTIYGEYLHDEIQAQDAWRSVLCIDPQHLVALESLKELTTRQADYQQLAEIINSLIAHDEIDQQRKLALWEELGKVQGDMLMNPPEAIEAWKNVIGLNPDHGEALDELEKLYLQESRWEEAGQVLELKADRTEDIEDRIELLMRVADIWETKLFERQEAARFYQRILDSDPTHMVASQSLETIYQEQGTEEAFAELASLYLDRAEVVDDVFQRVEILRNASRIFEEHLMQPDNALVVLLSAFAAETLEDEALSREVERLARQTGLWEEVIGRCEDILDELGDTLEAAELHRQVGRWRAEELDQPDEAVYHLRRALMIEPENLAVLEILEKLYRQLAAWPELAQVLHTQVDIATDPDAKVNLWRKLGELYEMQMGEIDDAIESYREILVIEPSDILAMESLERVFEAFQRWEELVTVLDQKAGATYDPDLIVTIKSRSAQIWEEELGDVSQAIVAYRDVLAVDQAHMPALEALERLYMESGQWNELIDVYEQQLGLTHEPDAQVNIYGKMASILENQFEDPERAVEAYNNVLMVDVENQTAIENLERLCRDLERWFDLADVLQRHIDMSQHVEVKVALSTELGRLQRDEVNNPHAAIESLEVAVQLDPVNPDVWEDLAKLHEETSNWERAVEAYERLVEQVEDEERRVEVYFRLGQLMEGQLHDHASAEDAYMSALRGNPTHPGVLDAVRKLLGILQQWPNLVRVLKAAEHAERDLDRKAELLCEIGQVYEENIEDEVSALRYFEEALELNPRNPSAAQPLIEVYVREQRFERAAPLLEMVLEEYQKGETHPEEIHRRNLQLAQAHRELSQPEKALQQYRNAYELQPTDLATLQGLGQVLFEHEEWEQASKVLQALQLHHEDKLEQNQLVDVYFRLGSIRKNLNDLRKAAQYFDRALELEQHHRPTLEQRAEVAHDQGKWEDVVHYTRWLLDTEEDPTVRFAKFSQIGDLISSKLNQPEQAVAAYQQALELEPKSVVILRKMLDLYTKTKQWLEGVEILMRIIEQEENASRISKYYYTAAVIYRDEIDEPTKAVELFGQALDADVKMLKAFEAIDRILTKMKSWKELSRAYRDMLHRLKDREDMEEIKVLLWTNLGEVYRTRRGDMETAIGAYEIAVGLNPGDDKSRLILAELYEKTGDATGVIKQHRELIKLDQFRVDSYRKLFKSYIQTKEYDRAWCMAGALSFLQSASEQEETFFKKYLGANLQAASKTFNAEMYKKLRHPDQDTLITYIMSFLGAGLRDNFSLSSIKVWGVHKRKDKVDLQEQSLCNKIYGYVTQTMNLLPAPQVYLKSDTPMGMRNANVNPQAVIMGGDVRQKSNDRELAFIIAKSLTWMLPEHYVGSIGQPTEFLKLLFMALMDLTEPSLGVGKTLGEQGQQVKGQIMQMQGPTLLRAQKLMKKFLAKGENPNLSRWLVSVEHSSIRMALLMSGDIHTAASCVKSDRTPLSKAGVKEKIREMVLFSISEEYFELREELGLAIGK